MRTNTLFIKWDRPAPGREKQAIELFGTANSFFAKKKNERIVDSYEPVLLSANGTHTCGFVLVHGDATKLDQLSHDDDFQELIVKLDVVLERLAVIRGYTGESLAKAMSLYAKMA